MMRIAVACSAKQSGIRGFKSFFTEKNYMRRKDREVTDRSAIIDLINKCDVCRIGINNCGYPYIVPLNFGLVETEDRIEFYFHGALDGLKYELLEKDPRVGFEMDCDHALASREAEGYCTMNYGSVIGMGHIEFIDDEETKLKALDILCRKYHPDGFKFNPAAAGRTRVFKLVVEKLSAKAKV